MYIYTYVCYFAGASGMDAPGMDAPDALSLGSSYAVKRVCVVRWEVEGASVCISSLTLPFKAYSTSVSQLVRPTSRSVLVSSCSFLNPSIAEWKRCCSCTLIKVRNSIISLTFPTVTSLSSVNVSRNMDGSAT